MFFKKQIQINWMDYLILVTLAVSVIWRGGKSIDITWILAGTASIIVIANFIKSVKIKKSKTISVPYHIWLAAVLFVFWTVISYIFSSAKNYGLDEVMHSAALMLIFFWTVRKGSDGKQFPYDNFSINWIRTVGIVTIVACVIGVMVYIFQPVNRFVGSFFDFRFHTDYWPNAWAQYLLLTWPVVFLWLEQGWNKKFSGTGNIFNASLRIILLGFVIGTFFLSYSRGATIAFAGQIILWAAVSYAFFRDGEKWKKIGFFALAVFLVSIVSFSYINELRSQIYDIVSVGEKVTFSSEEGTSSVSERKQFWAQAILLTAEKPLFGWGPYSFRFTQPRLESSVLATSDHPHNVLLKLAVERGLIAAILFIFILGSILIYGLRQELGKRKYYAALPGIMLIISLTGVISHNLIDYNLQFVGIALPFWMILGFLSVRSAKQIIKSEFKIQKWMELFIAIILIIVAFVEGGYLVVSSFGRHAEAKGESEVALIWYKKAEGELFSRDLHLSRAQILFNDGNFTASQEAVRQYLLLNNQDHRAWKRLGQIFEETRHFAQAINAYKEAFAYGKYNDIGILSGLIQTQVKLQQLTDINDNREEIDEMIIKYFNAMMLNTHFILQSENVSQFIDLCELMEELYPESAHVYQVFAAKVDDHARRESEKIASRPPGFLW